ncbi:MAG: SdrD B-like domain-containing protein [bacterium]
MKKNNISSYLKKMFLGTILVSFFIILATQGPANAFIPINPDNTQLKSTSSWSNNNWSGGTGQFAYTSSSSTKYLWDKNITAGGNIQLDTGASSLIVDKAVAVSNSTSAGIQTAPSTAAIKGPNQNYHLTAWSSTGATKNIGYRVYDAESNAQDASSDTLKTNSVTYGGTEVITKTGSTPVANDFLAAVAWHDNQDGNYDVNFHAFREGFVGDECELVKYYIPVQASAQDDNNQMNPDGHIMNGVGYGWFAMFWEDDRNGNKDIYYNITKNDVTKLYDTDVLVSDNDGIGAVDNDQKNVTVIGSNNYLLAAWEDYRNYSNGLNSDIYYRFVKPDGAVMQFGNSNGTTTSSRVSDNNTSLKQNPKVALAKDNRNLMIVWEDSRNGNVDIYGHRFRFAYSDDNDNVAIENVGEDFKINQIDAGRDDQTSPNIAYDTSGNALVIWKDGGRNNYTYGNKVAWGGNILYPYDFKISGNTGISNEEYADVGIDQNNNTQVVFSRKPAVISLDKEIYRVKVKPGYEPSGVLLSSVYYTGGTSNFGTVSFEATQPANTEAVVSVRTGNSAVPYDKSNGPGNWTNWKDVTSGQDMLSIHDRRKYLQYRVYLSSTDPATTPTVDNLVFNYNNIFKLNSIEPTEGSAGDKVLIRGENFGNTTGYAYRYRGTAFEEALEILEWSNTKVLVEMPAGVHAGASPIRLKVESYEIESEENFTVLPGTSNPITLSVDANQDGIYTDNGMEVGPGDLLTYKISLANNELGQARDLTNINVTNLVPTGTTYVPNSLYIGSTQVNSDNLPLASGYAIRDLPAGEFEQTEWESSGQADFSNPAKYSNGTNIEDASQTVIKIDHDSEDTIQTYDDEVVYCDSVDVDQITPDIAADSQGNIIIVYEEGGNIYSSRKDVNQNACSISRINHTAVSASNPQVAVSENGKYVVVWEDNRNSSQDIYYQVVLANDNKASAPVRVNDDNANVSQYNPNVAMDPMGNFVVVWEDMREEYTDDDTDIYFQQYDYDLNKKGSNVQVLNDSTEETISANQSDPAVAIDRTTNFVVTWVENDGSLQIIYARKINTDGSFNGSRFQVNADIPGTTYINPSKPNIALDRVGSMVFSWTAEKSLNDKDKDILIRRFSKQGSPVDSTYATRANDDETSFVQDYSSVTINDEDLTNPFFVVIWNDQRVNGSSNSTYAQTFDYNENKIDENNIELQIEKVNETNPSVVILPNNGFYSVWEEKPVSEDYKKIYYGGRYYEYYNTASLESSVIDLGGYVNFNTSNWSANVPAGTSLQVAARVADSRISEGQYNWTTSWINLSDGQPINEDLDNTRYIQYKTTLATLNPDTTPILRDIAFDYTSEEAITFQATVNNVIETETIDNQSSFTADEILDTGQGSTGYNTSSSSTSSSNSVSNPVVADPPAIVTMTADLISLVVDQNESTKVYAEITDQYGNKVEDGIEVNLFTSGNGTLDVETATTVDGVVETIYTVADEAYGTETITAEVADEIQGTIDITFYKESLQLSKSVGINTGSVLGAVSNNENVLAKQETSAATFLYILNVSINILLWVLLAIILVFLTREVIKAIAHKQPTLAVLKHRFSVITSIIYNIAKRPAVTFVIASQKDKDQQGTYQYSFTTFKKERQTTVWTISSALSLTLVKLAVGVILPLILLNFPGVLLASPYDDNGKIVSGGDELTYRIDYTNVGQEEINNIRIQDPVPSGLSFISSSISINSIPQTDIQDSDSAHYSPSSADTTFSISSVAPSSSGYVLFRAKVPNPNALTSISNNATGTFDPGARTVSSNTTSNPVVNGSISGVVFDDKNNDGRQNSTENGLQNVTINLYEDNGDRVLNRALDDLILSSSSNTSGNFSLNNIGGQSYIIDVASNSLPNDYGNTTHNEPIYVSLYAGENYAINFGYGLNVGTKNPDQEEEEVVIPEEEAVEIEVDADNKKGFDRIIDGARDIFNTLTNAISDAYNKNIVNNEALQRVNNQIAVPLVAASALLNSLMAFASSIAPYFTYLLRFITDPKLLFGGTAKRRKKWGTIYNSLTKTPVDLAIVRLFEKATNRLIETQVTGKEGRYAFIVEPNKEYYITVKKDNYVFPSKLLNNIEKDSVFERLYYGNPFTATAEEKSNGNDIPQTYIHYNIPLDPAEDVVFYANQGQIIKTTNNTLAKIAQLDKTKIAAENRKILKRNVRFGFNKIIAYLGPTIGILSFAISPSYYTGSFLIAHIMLFFLFKRLTTGAKVKPWGIVFNVDTTEAMSGAIVRLFDAQYGKLLLTKVTGRDGRYQFLVGPDRYILTIEKDGYYFPPKQVEIEGGKEGVVNRDIGLKKGNPPLN